MNCTESLSKRCRTRFNSWQVGRLEQVFLKTHYPDAQQMEGLSNETKIPTQKMQIWFQNRRAKWRKNSRLRNFGGLASVTETEYVPAPNNSDTIRSLILNNYSDVNNYNLNNNKVTSKEKYAIDLRMPSLKGSLSSYLMPTILDKSNAYKKAGGITNTNPHLSNHMNAFEYPAAYYNRHNMDNNDMPFAFASNQTMTSLLFAPHLYTLHMQSSSRYDSGVQITDIKE